MQVHYDLDQLPDFRNAVITIGTFDGVHKGHQQIIDAMQRVAAEIAGETVLITFHPHPRKIVQPDVSMEMINTLDEKIGLLDKKGVDHLVVTPFTKEFSSMSGETYIRSFLVEKFHPHTIIIGYDHHFGKNREGNFRLLEEKKELFRYELVEIPKHVLNEISVSSTSIREAIKCGDISRANNLLGYPFSFHGKVVHGEKMGRELGYPTANLVYTETDKIHFGEGVYAARAIVQGEMRTGMLSIGTRPSFNDVAERVEINLFDFAGDIYGEELIVIPVAYLRAQVKYETLSDLTEQMEKDKLRSLKLLNQTSS
jgi:riboflavin kinase / FMN adenylyltransferase